MPHLVLTVERLDDGEVSPYLVDELRPGDKLELRGPIGGYFVWEAALGGPLLLVAGGSGIVPFRSILRHHRAIESTVPVRLLYSARSLAEVIYREELTGIAADGAVDIRFTLTREQPEGWRGYGRRIDQELLGEVAWPPSERPLVYACGPTAFVETAASALVALGHEPASHPHRTLRAHRSLARWQRSIIEAHGVACVDLQGLEALEPAR